MKMNLCVLFYYMSFYFFYEKYIKFKTPKILGYYQKDPVILLVLPLALCMDSEVMLFRHMRECGTRLGPAIYIGL